MVRSHLTPKSSYFLHLISSSRQYNRGDRRCFSVMKLDLLTQVIQYLKQHEDSLRLKKLTYYLCQQVWENEQSKLDNADWQSSIEELINKKPNFASLTKYIYGMAETTTKPKKYLLVANVLINQLEKIYYVEEDETQACLTKFQAEVAPQKIEQQETTNPDDLYKIRAEIISNINPLRAKILLFSALNEQFTFSSQDWASLKSQQLDELISGLIDSCPTFIKLVHKLELTAGILPEANENLQVAKVISQSLKPFYLEIYT